MEKNRATPFAQTYFHGTTALSVGDLLQIGFPTNYGKQTSRYLFFTATLDAAIWGAELASGNLPGRIFVVEPTGEYENDPDLTDQRFLGNPTLSFRTQHPLRVLGEVMHWEGHPAEQIATMQATLAQLHKEGVKSKNEEP
jgi:rifampin ADP-ribosylating transferase